MGLKMAVVAEREKNYGRFTSPSVSAEFDKAAEKYGLEWDILRDEGIACEGDEFRAAILKIETQGVSWVQHDAEFLERIADYDIIAVNYEPITEQLLDAATNLKLVIVMRSGVENVDVDACTRHGVIVCNAPGRLKDPVSDFTAALILDINRGITYMNRFNDPSSGEELRPYFDPEIMKNLTIGLVGFGFIGQVLVEKLTPFGFSFLAYDPFVPQEVADRLGVKLTTLEEVMSKSDTVSVHARLTEDTKGMVSAEMIALMKPSAFFVNTARAGLVDEKALIKALQEEKIRGAALDVFQEEPLPADHALRQLKNVILTPHVAGIAGDTYAISAEIGMDQVGQFVAGQTPTAAVNFSSD